MTGLVSEAHDNDNKFDQDDDGDQIDQNYEDDCDCNDRNHFTEASPTTKEMIKTDHTAKGNMIIVIQIVLH